MYNMSFPDTFDYDTIEDYLYRSLTVEEKNMLENCGAENEFNNKLCDLYQTCAEQNLYCPHLSKLDGNCMFNSLVHLGIGRNVQQLRKVVSLMMYMYRDYKYLFPNNNSTLREMFDAVNEIEYVKCSDGKFYSYTYEVMCQDVANMDSWTKLPTEMLLMVLSYIFKLEIKIYNNLGSYENVINVFKDTPEVKTKTIFLGHIQEAHYIPLNYNFYNDDFIYYDEHLSKYKEWRRINQNMRYRNMGYGGYYRY